MKILPMITGALTGLGMTSAGHGMETIEWWCATIVVAMVSTVASMK